MFAALVGAGIVVPFGTAVALTPLRHPYEAAVAARSVARLSGLPYVAGIGPGAPEFQAKLRATPYPRPAAVSARYLDTMRALWWTATPSSLRTSRSTTPGPACRR